MTHDKVQMALLLASLASHFGERVTFEAAVERFASAGRSEIVADVLAGRVPATVPSFAQLHDHVDANEYGGLCGLDLVDSEIWDLFVLIASEVQDVLDKWIREGGLRQAVEAAAAG